MYQMVMGTAADKLAVARTDSAIKIIADKFSDIKIKRMILNNIEKTYTLNFTPENSDSFDVIAQMLEAVETGIADSAAIDLADYNAYMNAVNNRYNSLGIAALLERNYPANVLITRKNYKESDPCTHLIADRSGRQKQICDIVDSVECELTKERTSHLVGKLKSEEIEGIVLPENNIKMLKLNKVHGLKYTYFQRTRCVPESGQGILAIITRKDSIFRKKIRQIENTKSRKEYDIEKSIHNRMVLSEYLDLKSVCVCADIQRSKLEVNVYINVREHGYRFMCTDKYEKKDRVIEEILEKIRKIVDY